MMKTRVLLSQLPRILHDILAHAVLHQPDVELVEHGSGLGGENGPGAPDVVVVCGSGPTDPMALLGQWPGARIVVVTPTEGEATLYELRAHTRSLGRVSAADVVETIRSAVRPE